MPHPASGFPIRAYSSVEGFYLMAASAHANAPTAGASAHARLAELIQTKQACIGVIGLGYVGLPLVRAFTAAGFRCLGFDVDQAKVDKLKAGQSYIKHIDSSAIAQLIRDKQFEPTADMGRLAEADCIIICVPTPLNESRDPDLSYIEGTAQSIAKTLRPGQLVVLESTTHPTTTRVERAAGSRGDGPEVRHRLLPGLQPRARGSRQPALPGGHDSQGRRRVRRARAASSPAPCTATPS